MTTVPPTQTGDASAATAEPRFPGVKSSYLLAALIVGSLAVITLLDGAGWNDADDGIPLAVGLSLIGVAVFDMWRGAERKSSKWWVLGGFFIVAMSASDMAPGRLDDAIPLIAAAAAILYVAVTRPGRRA